MTLNELHAALLARTKRVDKQDELRTSIRKAIRMVHSAAYFPQDIVEESVALHGTFTDFKLPLPPRMRKLVQLAPLTSEGKPVMLPTVDGTFDLVSSSNIINSFYERKSNICYPSGNTLTVKSSMGVSNLYMSFYAYPEVADNEMESWLMRENEAVFIDAALSDFYLLLGRQRQANAHKQEMLMQLQAVIDSYAGGYY